MGMFSNEETESTTVKMCVRMKLQGCSIDFYSNKGGKELTVKVNGEFAGQVSKKDMKMFIKTIQKAFIK
jgi:hypothetical protein